MIELLGHLVWSHVVTLMGQLLVIQEDLDPLFKKINKVIDSRPGEIMFGLNMIVNKGKTVFIGDTSVHEYPTSEQLAEIAISASRVVRLFGFDPKVAFVSHSTFGQPVTSRTKHIRNAVEILKQKKLILNLMGICSQMLH